MFFAIFLFQQSFDSCFYGVRLAPPRASITCIGHKDWQVIWSIWDGSILTGHGGRLPYQVDIFANEPAQHIHHTFYCIIQIQLFGRDGLAFWQPSSFLREISRSPGCILNFIQICMQIVIFICLQQCQFRMSQDHPQHVVKIMGHTTGQAADRLHLLGLIKLGLHFSGSVISVAIWYSDQAAISPFNRPVVINIIPPSDRIPVIPDTDPGRFPLYLSIS